MRAFTGYAVVDGCNLSSILGVEYHSGGKVDLPIGCHFGAVFFKRKFALEKAKQWGDTAKVVRVRIEEAVR